MTVTQDENLGIASKFVWVFLDFLKQIECCHIFSVDSMILTSVRMNIFEHILNLFQSLGLVTCFVNVADWAKVFSVCALHAIF